MTDKGGIKRNVSQNFLSRLVTLFVSIWTVASISVFDSEPAEAQVLNVEILSSITSSNNSQTTPAARWLSARSATAVSFEISGAALANASVNLAGNKYAVLVIPQELRGKVLPNGQAAVNTSIILKLEKVPLLTNTLSAVDQLVDLIGNIQKGALGSLTGVEIDFAEVNRQLALLDSLENFGSATFQEPLQLTTGNTGVYANLDDGLGPILASELSQILTKLVAAVNALEAKGTGLGALVAPVINEALKPVKGTLANAVSILLPLLTVGGQGVQQLADAAVLGSTTVQMPVLVTGPGNVATNLDAKFVGTVIEASIIDINLLSSANGVSYIYFKGVSLDFNGGLLPDALNFGSHPIQTDKDETFTATTDGNSGSSFTTGKVVLTDTRAQTKNWQVKVRQSAGFENQQQSLAAAELSIHGGGLVSDFPAAQVFSISNQKLTLAENEQQTVLAVENATAAGTISLDLRQFDLFVPKNSPKVIGEYQTTLVWTVTDSP